jgi:hypothetical protein
MNRSYAFPVIIDVIAHLLDQTGHEMSTGGLMPAPLNFHSCGPKISSKDAYARKSFSVQCEDER